jgi:hypothetical protein
VEKLRLIISILRNDSVSGVVISKDRIDMFHVGRSSFGHAIVSMLSIGNVIRHFDEEVMLNVIENGRVKAYTKVRKEIFDKIDHTIKKGSISQIEMERFLDKVGKELNSER